jgi:hypothetical protein
MKNEARTPLNSILKSIEISLFAWALQKNAALGPGESAGGITGH